MNRVRGSEVQRADPARELLRRVGAGRPTTARARDRLRGADDRGGRAPGSHAAPGRVLGIPAPGAVIGLSGGLLAAVSIAMSGLIGWTTAQLGDANTPGIACALAALGFAVGSAGFVVPLGLLVAGLAVPSLLLRLTYRPLAWAGLAVAAISMLSTFTLLTPVLDATLPVGRFGSLIWLVLISITMPHSRHEVPRPVGQAVSPLTDR